MKRIKKYAIWFGILLIIAGFMYDVVFAGIPYQDAPIDLEIKYERNQSIAYSAMMVGMTLVVLAGLVKLIDKIGSTIKRQKEG